MPRPNNFDINPIIERLQGNCMMTLNDAIEELHPEMTEDDLTEGDRNQFDNELFLCDQCGWWCEISEQCAVEDSCANTGYCSDCCEENGHDEEEEYDGSY